MAEERDHIVGADAEETPSAEEQKQDRLMEDIEKTRANMGETIDAIQERLSLSNISEQVTEQVSNAVDTAKEAVYDATVGKVVSIMKNVSNEISSKSIVRTAKNNPLPLALIGLGAGMLAYQTYSRASYSARRASLASAARENNSESSRQGGVSRAVAGVSDAASSALEKVNDAVSGVYDTAGEAASTIYEKADGLRHAAADRYETYIEENPLAVGAVALALGAAVGFAIPTTEYEGELMGPVRQELFEKAETTAAGLLDRAKDSLSSTATA